MPLPLWHGPLTAAEVKLCHTRLAGAVVQASRSRGEPRSPTPCLKPHIVHVVAGACVRVYLESAAGGGRLHGVGRGTLLVHPASRCRGPWVQLAQGSGHWLAVDLLTAPWQPPPPPAAARQPGAAAAAGLPWRPAQCLLLQGLAVAAPAAGVACCNSSMTSA